jgi:hypothetical protein
MPNAKKTKSSRIEAAFHDLFYCVMKTWSPLDAHFEQYQDDMKQLRYLVRLAKKGAAHAER